MGFIILVIINGISVALWLFSKTASSGIPTPFLLGLSQGAAIVGATMLAMNFILATRLSFLEDLFGGQDKVYRIHRGLGTVSFILLVNHPTLLAVQSIADPHTALMYFWPSAAVAYNFGIFALWAMILLLVVTLFIKLQYHRWFSTHRLFGIALAFAALHMLKISSDISRAMPLRLWILGWTGLALASALYKFFFYASAGPVHRYRVAAVTTRVSVIDIKLKPTGKPLVFSPGQFGFMTVHTDAVGEESHPFSFASGPDDPVLRFAIKKSGDYTERLRKLKSGDPVSVHGPYGRFAARYLRGTTNAIWIAGGIGVTPFVSLLQHEVTQDADRQVRFYYSGLENEKDAPFAQEISQLAGKAARIKYTYFQSTRQNFLTAKHISASVPDFQTRLILICGPMVMMEALKRQFIALGVPAQNIIYEDFNLL